jgi:hypothetical protein
LPSTLSFSVPPWGSWQGWPQKGSLSNCFSAPLSLSLPFVVSSSPSDATLPLTSPERRREQELKMLFQLKVATMQEASSKFFNLQAPTPQPSPRSPIQLFNTFTALVEEKAPDSADNESASWPLIILVIMTSTICGISSRCFQLESRLYFFFTFEFEYRKHRTIKGHANR